MKVSNQNLPSKWKPCELIKKIISVVYLHQSCDECTRDKNFREKLRKSNSLANEICLHNFKVIYDLSNDCKFSLNILGTIF